MIAIPRDLVEKILSHLNRELPNEGCGYLAGSGSRITHFFPMTNADHSPIHFSFVPTEQFEISRTVRTLGITLIGVVHSHPGGSAILSAKDCDLADPSLFQIVIVPDSQPAQIEGFCFADHSWHLVEIAILD